MNMMNRPKLDLSLCNNDEMEESFAIHNGQFVKGNVEISSSGVTRSDRAHSYTGLSADEIVSLKIIGRGASSQVHLAKHKTSGSLMAVKVINMYEKSKRAQILQEIATLYDASDCPALVKFYGAFYNEGSISIAIEYMDQGCLSSMLQRYGKIPEKPLAAITFQSLWGLGYLKHAKRVHRDIKTSNLLCNSQGESKLTDFGISKELENSIGCQTFVGTFEFMAPERIQGVPYSYASDIWSLGLVILECATGKYPYPKCTAYIDLVQTILENDAPKAPSDFSPEFADFTNCCLRKKPSARVPAEILLNSPWMAKHGIENLAQAQAILKEWLQSRAS